MKLTSTAGFTLIEVMIAMAIIGILAAIALPAYQAHVGRSQAARVMAEASGLRSIIEACLNEGKMTVGAGANDCNPKAVGSSLIDGVSQTGMVLAPGHGVPQVTVGAGGVATIEATFSNTAFPLFHTKTLTWSRALDGGWSCSTTIDDYFRPKGCDL